MITMLLGGLWHGASWNFIIWGGLHGLYLALHKIFSDLTRRPTTNRIGSLTGAILTFNLVTLTWVFFRSANLNDAIVFLSRVFTWQDSSGVIFELTWLSPKLWITVGIVFALDWLQNRTKHHAVFLDLSWPVRGSIYASGLLLILGMGGLDGQVPFLYFQF